LSVERSSRNSSINLLPSRLRWINLSLANLAKFKNNVSFFKFFYFIIQVVYELKS